MALARWNPWGELFSLQDQLDQLVGDVFGHTVMPSGAQAPSVPAALALDIRQTDAVYTIEASVPGFKPEEVEVTLDENVLTIRGEHREEADDSKGGYVRRERRSSSVFRQIGLPAEVRADGITAEFRDGVLTVTVPRAQKSQPRRIAVHGAGEQQVVEAGSSPAEATSAQQS